MTELIINVHEDAVEFVEEFVERIGGSSSLLKKERLKSQKKEMKEKLSDHFGSWPDIDLDPKTYRKKLWGKRIVSL